MKSRARSLARITPTVLFPEPGMPIKTMLDGPWTIGSFMKEEPRLVYGRKGRVRSRYFSSSVIAAITISGVMVSMHVGVTSQVGR